MMTTYRHIWVVSSVAYIHEDRNLSQCDTHHLFYTDHIGCFCYIWVRASVVYNHQDRYQLQCHKHHPHYTGHRVYYSRCHSREEGILYEFEGSLWWKANYWKVLSSLISHGKKRFIRFQVFKYKQTKIDEFPRLSCNVLVSKCM